MPRARLPNPGVRFRPLALPVLIPPPVRLVPRHPFLGRYLHSPATQLTDQYFLYTLDRPFVSTIHLRLLHLSPTRLTDDEFLTIKTLVEAAESRHVSTGRPAILAQRAGGEKLNAAVDNFVELGMPSRVLALRDVMFSNSMIEAWWRTLEYQWLFLNILDSVETVRRLVALYVAAHNTETPHAAFRAVRLKANRESSCVVCELAGLDWR